MIFNSHSNLQGLHAVLGASKYHWVNYDEEKLDRYFLTSMAAQKGVALHELAHNLIKLGVKLPRNSNALNNYVNDAIGYKMTSEQALFYSENCFGTADAISFRKSLLRIHDLKTGVTPASMKQLEVYAALFCLEYRIKPSDIGVELRIYQNSDVQVHVPDVPEIVRIMDKIITFDKRIQRIRQEAI